MYHALSNNSSIVQRERLEYLGKAITCAVLGKGKAGPQGSRVLGLLHKDERLKELEALQVQGKGTTFASHASILTKLYMERLLLDQNELDTFENSLVDHQRAIISDGRTYLQKAVIEHNMQAASKIYENIAFPELGSILRLGTKEAEAVAAKMISDKHLHASIDQTENMLIFGGAMPDGADTAGLISWDDRIHDICKEASDAVDVLVLKYPALHEITDV